MPDAAAAFAGSYLETSIRCWRDGHHFARCCNRNRPGVRTECWDHNEFTFEQCCLPPVPPPASNLFEDFNCNREGGVEWEELRKELELITLSATLGHLDAAAEHVGGSVPGLVRRLRGRLRAQLDECPVGALALQLALLFLCLAQGQRCAARWAGAASAMRSSSPSIMLWAASAWPILDLWVHIHRIVVQPDAACAATSFGVDWPLFREMAGRVGLVTEELMREFYRAQSQPLDRAPCEGGREWRRVVEMHLCARTEVKCALSYGALLDFVLRGAASSGPALLRWARRAGEWHLAQWAIELLGWAVRHRHGLGLTADELRLLGAGAAGAAEPGGGGCLDPRGEGVLDLPFIGDAASRRLARCRAWCAAAHNPTAPPWAFFGASSSGRRKCFCASAGVRLRRLDNCSAHGLVEVYEVLTPPEQGLRQAALELGPAAAPVLAAAAESVANLDPSAPVFATMVFGHMAQHLGRFAARLRALRIPNVVVLVLDAEADRECKAGKEAEGFPEVCLQGDGRTALQKYVVVLAYLFLGWDVFWFDFDSVWLQNPVPFLQGLPTSSADQPEAPVIFAAIDFDSVNCAMNAFFFIRASAATQAWVLFLLHWIYKRPLAHDQLAFTTLLGIGPLVDEEPLPKPPEWAPLDPNVFANAARFSGLGFTSEVEDLVLFHFFDGWNSNQPDEVEFFATPVYQGQNLFDVLYGDDSAAAREAIAKSRLPKPAQLRDCRFMTTLGLGVELKEPKSMLVSVAMA